MRPAWLLSVTLLGSGCWNYVEDHCAGCTIVEYSRPLAPPVRAGSRAVVVLVHGAFGFGDEWDPVVPALRRQRDVDWYVFRWPGPWRDVPRMATALARTLQGTVEGAPPSVREVVVLAHSAGGMIANYAARTLRVPPGRHVTVALLDSPLDQRVSPVVYEREVDTPLGIAIGAHQLPYPSIPAGVSLTDYKARDAPRASPEDAVPAATSDIPRIFVGDLGHNRMVGVVVLPLLDELDRHIHAP